MPNASLIFNPQAGPASMSHAIVRVAEYWRRRGWKVRIYPTRKPGHATQLAQQAVNNRERLVFSVGGDGTLREVAHGLAGSDVILAPLPAGTGNSLTKEWKLPQPGMLKPWRLLDASDALWDGKVQRMDVAISSTNQHWLLWSGVGLDGYLVNRLEPRSKLSKRFGRWGYLTQFLWALPGYKGMRAEVTIDGEKYADDFMMITICNCRRFGGGELLLNPKAIFDDGKFEVWMATGKGLSDALRLLAAAKKGEHLQSPHVKMIQGKQIEVVAEPKQPFHLDGDPAGISPLSSTVKPAALNILVPTTAPPGLFLNEGEPLEKFLISPFL